MTPVVMECNQGSMEWFTARMGIPTASKFSCIVTSTGKPTKSAARQTYLCELLGERLTRRMTETYVSAAMERGTMLEPRARAWYQVETGRQVRKVGFVYPQEHGLRFGCSPDGLCDDRGIEIKCPMRHTLIGQLLSDGVPEEYMMQIQAGMWICDKAQWDLVLFTDEAGIANRITTVERDAAMCAAFEQHVLAFCDELDEAESRLRAMGCGV